MSLLDRARKEVRRIVGGLTGKQDEVQQAEQLEHWQEKLRQAITRVDFDLIDEREQIYSGSHIIESRPGQRRAKDASNVRNVTYEMVESQVDTTIPMPTVKAKRRGLDFLASMVEDSHEADIQSELPIQRINDQMERITPVQGQSYVLVGWNPDYTHKEFVGELEITHIHPKQLIPQPGVFDIQEMDYFFILSSVTEGYIKRRFDVELDGEREEYPQIGSVEGDGSEVYDSSYGASEKVTLVTGWYKDDEGEIGRICWVNDTLLEDNPKFFHRRQAVCQECGEHLPQGTKECECGGKTKVEQLDSEALDYSLELEPVSYTKRRNVVVRDELGRAVGVEEVEEEVVEERIIEAGTEIPYYAPKRYPLAVRTNTPKSFSLGGMSDVDVIRDQQESIKKVLSKMQKKIINGGSYLVKGKDTKFTPTNADNQVIEVETAAEAQVLTVKTLQADIGQDMAFYREQYESVQSTLGITDSFQGKRDTTAPSGKAKEIQVQQSAGRLLSKILNKHDFYKQLYEIMFEFKLAFYDETRPFIKQNPDGTDDWGDFDKYQFLLQDAAGEWYYCTDFIFNSDSGQGIPSDKVWLYEQIMALYQAQAIDLVMLWTILEQLKFPHAGMILTQVKQRQEEAEEMEQAAAGQMMEQEAAMQAEGMAGQQGGFEQLLASLSPEQQEEVMQIIASMSPEAQAAFMALPPDQMEAALMQAMQG